MTAVVLRGDARRLPLPDGCVDLIVTSPPFWQLRSYTDGGKHYDGQIGSEPTWQEYIANLIECTQEWARVLKPDGNMFVELGDKYSDRGHGPNRGKGTGRGPQGTRLRQTRGPMEKCLLDLPHRYSIAAVDQLGLIKRANIVWHHTNGLPESSNDRVKVAHSMVFHFTRQPRYYAAVDEIREPHDQRFAANHKPGSQNGHKTPGTGMNLDLAGVRKPPNPLGKLPGSVWPIPSQPLIVPPSLGIDHFAAFPCSLVRPLVLGWSPPGVCTGCGQGRRPVSPVTLTDAPGGARHDQAHTQRNNGGGVRRLARAAAMRSITGYACACPTPDAPTRPSLVLDPFAGTGTTMLVASAYGRVGVGVDRSMDYARLARWRCSDPGERARARDMPKPPPVPEGMETLF